MTRKEIINQILSRVPEEKKESFIREMTECKDLAEKAAVLEKYGVQLTPEEMEAISAGKVTDEELDEAAGGCCQSHCSPSCHCPSPDVSY